MLKCGICGYSDFYKASGYFFCTICQTQSQDVGEEVELELPIESTARLRKTKIHRVKNDKTGLTNEFIELGISADIKITVLQLWARYLGKLEVAFISAKEKLIPKLARRYKKRDAEIIYGKVLSQTKSKKQRKSTNNIADSIPSACLNEETSLRELNRNKKLMITADYDRFMQLQTSSERDVLSTFSQSVYSTHSSTKQSCESMRIQFNSSAKEETSRIKNMAKKVPRYKRSKYKQSHVTTRYKTGPDLITPTKLWAILYLALRIHNQDIHLGDMIRYGREGRLSYYRLDRLIPPEVSLTKSDINFLSRAMDITHKGMRRIIGQMAKFLGVTRIICPDLLSLVNRYCTELALPKDISSYAERLISLFPPKMMFDKKSCIPNYEGRAMAFIIVVLKTLLSLDDITENEISNVVDKINSAISDEGIYDTKLFSFREWQKYVECRRAVLINTHCPTKLKYNPNIPDVNSLFIKFLESIGSKTDREEPETIMDKHLIPRELRHAMKQCINNVNSNDLPLNAVNEFSSTLMPNHLYLQQLLEYPLYDLPSMLRNDFSFTESEYLTKSESVYKLLALQYNIQLNSIDSNLHFIEKAVPLFEQTKIISVKDLKCDIAVEDFMAKDIKCVARKEDFIDYLHKKIPCRLKIDIKKRQYYDNIWNTMTNVKALSLVNESALVNEFIFNDILPDGKLSISGKCPDNNENTDDDDDDDIYLKDIVFEQTKLFSKLNKTYNTNFSNTEERAMFKDSNWLKKQKRKLIRNRYGKFVQQKDAYLNIEKEHSSNKDDYYAEEVISATNTSKIENIIPEIPDVLNLSTNAFVFDNFIQFKSGYNMDDQSEKFCKVEESMIDESFFTLDKKPNDIFTLFKPFKDYWMYHCNFSRVKPKNFELLEKMMPRSFRWLLNECASVIEISTKDLYEEVCLIEGYYAYVSEQSKIYSSNTTNKIENCNNQAYINTILKKW
ncbi:uncharacterized protein LOC105201074 isoform X2 [Solenopsis invicta]|uniref:uncharacterized protein LOC105201074 isoform X2 n=1 Tax=Solenopsis invicta TaxID=13686 RepID=UPI00193DA22A|nr:uncharacterized protein LOC105201074 isoform X2 [Solenopsis invicta]